MEQLTLFDPGAPTGSVYVGARNGFLKIGYSRQPTVRARQLRLTLLYTTPGTVTDERRLHQRFAADRIDREWFMPSPSILRWITDPAA